MTLAASTIVQYLFLVLATAVLLYKRPWRREFHGGLAELRAAQVAEALIACFFLIFVVALVIAILDAIVWTLPWGTELAPAWAYFLLVADGTMLLAFCWVALRRWQRFWRHRNER
jgi:hypothetical protein